LGTPAIATAMTGTNALRVGFLAATFKGRNEILAKQQDFEGQ
jgi:hypothetical protein